MTTPQPAVLPAHSAMFAALAVPNFRRYVSGQSLSLIGTWVETVAQALLVLRLTHSGTILGLTTAARYAPILLLSPYAGLLVQRGRQAIELAQRHGWAGEPFVAIAYPMLAGSLIWQGELEEAERWLMEGEYALQAEVEPATGMLFHLVRPVPQRA